MYDENNVNVFRKQKRQRSINMTAVLYFNAK